MYVQKLTLLNFEKIIIIIFFSESTSQKTQKKMNFIKIGQCFGHLLNTQIIRMFLNGIKIQLELIVD